MRLDLTDRKLRFCGHASDRSIRAYCTQIDWARTTILGFFVEQEICAASELVRTKEMPPGEAEVALSVEKTL